jgi:hypothetical protein
MKGIQHEGYLFIRGKSGLRLAEGVAGESPSIQTWAESKEAIVSYNTI